MDEGEMVRSGCPSCGAEAERRVYDVGSGPELSCANCEWCWGADGQDLQPLERPFFPWEPPTDPESDPVHRGPY